MFLNSGGVPPRLTMHKKGLRPYTDPNWLKNAKLSTPYDFANFSQKHDLAAGLFWKNNSPDSPLRDWLRRFTNRRIGSCNRNTTDLSLNTCTTSRIVYINDPYSSQKQLFAILGPFVRSHLSIRTQMKEKIVTV